MNEKELKLLEEIKDLIQGQETRISILSREVANLGKKINSLTASKVAEEIFAQPAQAPTTGRFFKSDFSKEKDELVRNAKKLIYALLKEYESKENRSFAPMINKLFADEDFISSLRSTKKKAISYAKRVLKDEEAARKIDFNLIKVVVFYIIKSEHYFTECIKVNSVFVPGILDSGAVEDYEEKNKSALKYIRDIIGVDET